MLDVSTSPKAGNMTADGGLAAIFDGDPSTVGTIPSSTGVAWVRLDPPRKIDRLEVISPSNGFDNGAGTPTVYLTLRGQTGTATPTGATSANNLGGYSFIDANEQQTKVLDCPNKDTLYSWIGVSISTGGACSIAEVKVYEVEEVIPDPVPDLPPVVVSGTLEERVYALEQRLTRPFVWHANSGHDGELVTSLPVTPNSPYTFKTIYSIALPTLYAGDLLQAFALAQFTNDTNLEWVMAATYITLGTSPTDTNLVGRISEAKGRNVGRITTHHDPHPDFASYVVPENVEGLYLNFVGYAGHVNGTGQLLDVDQGYGRLFATVTRAAVVE
jgi:hypothetical protein